MSSLSKIVITGKVVRNPEKRFTSNNLTITTFAINIGTDTEEKLVRVFAVGKLGDVAANTVIKDQGVVIEGKLQTATVKSEAGVEKKIVEISANAIEIIGTSIRQESEEETGSDISDFDMAEDISDEELIGEDEIPF